MLPQPPATNTPLGHSQPCLSGLGEGQRLLRPGEPCRVPGDAGVQGGVEKGTAKKAARWRHAEL